MAGLGNLPAGRPERRGHRSPDNRLVQSCIYLQRSRDRKQGSLSQITGRGNVIKASPSNALPTLPNIPCQADLDEDRFEHCIVPADDLDGAVIAMRGATGALAARLPRTRMVADYSGGTKTMTAALVCVALERDDVDLQLVTGARPDLDRVADGTEQPMTASVARLRLDRAMGPYLSAWRRYAYDEAATGLDRIRIAADAPDRARLGLASALIRALARWDDFDHAGALLILEPFVARFAQSYPSMLPTLRLLAGIGPQQEPARLLDLWLNAQRRAAQGRYDDAVARVYRMIEWTAQWLLQSQLGADTADFPDDRLPPQVEACRDRDGEVKLGLWDAWQVAGPHPGSRLRSDRQPRRPVARPAPHPQRFDSRARFHSRAETFLGADGKLGTGPLPAGSVPLRARSRPEETS